MNLCSDKHEEICYECRNCPLCEMRKSLGFALDDIINEVEQKNKEISALEERLNNAE